MMPSVPKLDRVEENEGQLKNAFAVKGSIGQSIIHLYKWKFVKNGLIMGLSQACFCSLALFLYLLLIDVSKAEKEEWDSEKKFNRFAIWYGAIVATQFLGSIFINYVMLDLGRLGIRLKNTVIFAIYKKTLKVSVLNPNQHTEGKIVNYVQVSSYQQG